MSKPFEGEAAANYHNGPPRQVPGFHDMLRMVAMLLRERVPDDGSVLVLGAGGGLELQAMADSHPAWRFTGVDPSQDMLTIAQQTNQQYSDRVEYLHGYIDTAPAGPFDGATCLLTMHFIPREQRLDTLTQIRQRLKPGSPFAMAHISFPQAEPDRTTWITRHLMWAGTPPERIESARETIKSVLSILSPDDEESLLQEAGFTGVSTFYAGLSLRGWIAYS